MLTFTEFLTPPRSVTATETDLYALSSEESSPPYQNVLKLVNGTWITVGTAGQTYGGEPPVAVNPSGILVSPDGQTIIANYMSQGYQLRISVDGGGSWTDLPTTSTNQFARSVVDLNRFYFHSEDGEPTYTLTTKMYDGSWHNLTPSDLYITDVCGNNGNYLAKKNDGTIWSSTDGLAWSQLSAQPELGMGGDIRSMTFSAGKFYVFVEGMMGNGIQSYSAGAWVQETVSGLESMMMPTGLLANAASSPAMEWYLYVTDMMGGPMYRAVSYSIPATIDGDVTIEPVGGVINISSPITVDGTSSLTLNIDSVAELQGTSPILVLPGGTIKVGNGRETTVVEDTRYVLTP